MIKSLKSSFFQNNAALQLEGSEELYNIVFYLTIILFAVSWIMLSLFLFNRGPEICDRRVKIHTDLAALFWTITPALILIAFFSIKLVYTTVVFLAIPFSISISFFTSSIYFWCITIKNRSYNNMSSTTSMTERPPKPYAFVETALQSSLNDIAIAVLASSIIPTIMWASARIFIMGCLLTFYFRDMACIASSPVIHIMEQMLLSSQHVLRVARAAIASPDVSHATLIELHQYLTPFIRSAESTWHVMLTRIVNFFEDNNCPDFDYIDTLFHALRDSGNDLFIIYRRIEQALNIPLQDSPIPVQGTEY